MTEASSPKPPTSAPSPRRPTPVPGQPLSDGQKEALAIQALGLLNEQAQARKAPLETGPEFAIPARGVAPLKTAPAIFDADGNVVPKPPPEEVEEQQTRALVRLLSRFFSVPGQLAAHTSKSMSHRLARLFFESELPERSPPQRDKVIQHAEQGVYYLLSRYRHRLRAEAFAFEFQSPEVRQATIDLLLETERDLQVAYLTRRSPELNRLMSIFAFVLEDFLQKDLPLRLEQMGKATVRVSKSARRPSSIGHQVQVDAFSDFRAEWERLFMQRLVFFCTDQLLDRLGPVTDGFGEQHAELFTDPRVFREMCAILCDKLYDFLSLEGFLELPNDWRIGPE